MSPLTYSPHANGLFPSFHWCLASSYRLPVQYFLLIRYSKKARKISADFE
ncbi:hypothetical protein CDL12_28824 [Handroanthus impetiginosus]|uniref:Uncharacterized protein n=1 Tax=Handroanthus impetiginosus TaxID=429701 RepID=A0A2G9G0H6_9LAMI|nr:hypothetical protein CDL12_28824 [Handroanthus impetiginosus]